MEEQVKSVLAKVFCVAPDQIAEDTSPDTLGEWTSLNHMQLMAALEDQFNIFISEEDSIRLVNYPKVVNYISRTLED